MPEALITICLLNYRRPQNLIHVLNSIEIQTVPTQVFIWNNSEDQLPESIVNHPLVKLVVTSNMNLGCFPRWWMASLNGTGYVCSLDDDVVLVDEKVLADAMTVSRDKCPDGIVGPFGWRHVGKKGYRASKNVYGRSDDQWVDIIKGKFMLFRRTLLKKIPLDIPTLPRFDGISRREDDIYVSLSLADGQWGKHLVPGILKKRVRDMAQRTHASSDEPGHYGYRDESIRVIRQWLIKP